ncbi:MAG: hypothetical protein J6Y11_00515 [Paludibacteraceae bacterium]|nr:hypothetical protein [Paludibacteraceae bacterium]
MNKNILNKILLATLPLMAINANAATPQSFNYQSVVRSTSGSPIANQTVFVKVEILRDNLGSNEVVYSEMHNATTNVNGSFAIKIGEGSAATGSFSGIDWSTGKFVIKTTTSTNSDFTDAVYATSAISSVPYALYSLKSADSFSGRWNDLTGKPDMSEYAKIEDVAAYSADSTRKILTDYATKDDVLDLHNRGLRSSNYRIDSLKSVVNANNYWITELQADAAKYATKSEISSFAKKDTLSSYATNASVNTLSKNTSEAISELSQTVQTNKTLSESNYKNLKEVNKLYAKKDTLQYFMTKSGMSYYATNDALRALDKSVGSISQSLNSTDLRASELANTVSTLSTTVSDNKKEVNKKIEAIQTELGKVDDKILSSERKAQADDLVLNNKISTNENKIKGLTAKDSVLEANLNSKTTALNTKVDSISKSHNTAINNLSNKVSANATASSKEMKSKVDSLSKVISGKLDTLNINITKSIDEEVFNIENEIDGIESTLNSHSSSLALNTTGLSNLNSMVTQLVTWAQKVEAKNDSLVKELDKAKAKHLADSTEADGKYRELLSKVVSLNEENLTDLINKKIAAALTAAGLNGISTSVSNLESKVNTLDGSINNETNGLAKRVSTLETSVNDNTNGLTTKVSALQSKVSDLETSVNDENGTGLAKKVSDLNNAINNTDTGLAKKVSDLNNAINNTDTGLAKKVSDLETSVNDENSNGLAKKVSVLETSINDDTDGLAKKVSDLDNAINNTDTGLSPRVSKLEGKINW